MCTDSEKFGINGKNNFRLMDFKKRKKAPGDACRKPSVFESE
jgi:hypothetical protein